MPALFLVPSSSSSGLPRFHLYDYSATGPSRLGRYLSTVLNDDVTVAVIDSDEDTKFTLYNTITGEWGSHPYGGAFRPMAQRMAEVFVFVHDVLYLLLCATGRFMLCAYKCGQWHLLEDDMRKLDYSCPFKYQIHAIATAVKYAYIYVLCMGNEERAEDGTRTNITVSICRINLSSDLHLPLQCKCCSMPIGPVGRFEQLFQFDWTSLKEVAACQLFHSVRAFCAADNNCLYAITSCDEHTQNAQFVELLEFNLESRQVSVINCDPCLGAFPFAVGSRRASLLGRTPPPSQFRTPQPSTIVSVAADTVVAGRVRSFPSYRALSQATRHVNETWRPPSTSSDPMLLRTRSSRDSCRLGLGLLGGDSNSRSSRTSSNLVHMESIEFPADDPLFGRHKLIDNCTGFPAARTVFGCVPLCVHGETRLYVVGGLQEINDPIDGLDYAVASDIWYLSVDSGQWHRMEKAHLPVSCGQFFACNSVLTADGELYMPAQTSDGVFRLLLKPPRLLTTCLRTLFARYPSTRQLSDAQLRSMLSFPDSIIKLLNRPTLNNFVVTDIMET